jgi:SHS2 domain-containing protein
VREEPKYKFLEHITDAEIEAYGDTLDEAFENAALALEDTMVDSRTVLPKNKLSVKFSANDREGLLYSWLEWLIVEQEIDALLFSKFHCKIVQTKGYELEAEAWGEKYDPSRHEQRSAVKAPTYHDMEIKKETLNQKERVKIRFLLDL